MDLEPLPKKEESNDLKETQKEKIIKFVQVAQKGCKRVACLREFCRKNPGRFKLLR